MRFLSFIFIHIFIGYVHYIVKPEIFYRSNGCAHACGEDIGSTASPVQLCHFILYLFLDLLGKVLSTIAKRASSSPPNLPQTLFSMLTLSIAFAAALIA